MPENSAARLGLTIRFSASIVAALSAAGAVWTWTQYGLAAAIPFLPILVVTAVAGWNAAAMAARTFRTLRTAEGRLQAAAEALPDGLVVFDRNDRIVFYNSRYPEMMTEALRAGLEIGKRFEDWMREGIGRGPVYHPDMGDDFLERRLSMRSEPHSEHAMRIADGRWMRVRDNRMEDGSRVLLITDITEERRRAAELRLLALAVEQAGDPVEITGPDHGFTYVNHAFETTTGYSAAEALGREPQDILSSGIQPPEFFAAMRRELEAGRRWKGTIVNRHRDGHLIEQETTIAPAARRARTANAFRRGQARRDRGTRAGAGAGRQRGALPRGGGRADRVHRAAGAGRLLDLHERGRRALHRLVARGDAHQGASVTPTWSCRRTVRSMRRISPASRPRIPPAPWSGGAYIQTAACTGSTGPTPASSTPRGGCWRSSASGARSPTARWRKPLARRRSGYAWRRWRRRSTATWPPTTVAASSSSTPPPSGPSATRVRRRSGSR